MENIPTAEKFLWSGKIITQGDTEPYGHLPNEKIPLVMIEFTKMHIEQFAKEFNLSPEWREGMVNNYIEKIK